MVGSVRLRPKAVGVSTTLDTWRQTMGLLVRLLAGVFCAVTPIRDHMPPKLCCNRGASIMRVVEMQTVPVILLDFDNKRIVQVVPGHMRPAEFKRALELAHATAAVALESSPPAGRPAEPA